MADITVKKRTPRAGLVFDTLARKAKVILDEMEADGYDATAVDIELTRLLRISTRIDVDEEAAGFVPVVPSDTVDVFREKFEIYLDGGHVGWIEAAAAAIREADAPDDPATAPTLEDAPPKN